MATNFKDYLAQQMEDPKFAAEYDALEPEYAFRQALIDARKESGLTQMELSQKTGIAQCDISKMENGNANPSFRTLVRIAKAMDMKLRIGFVKAYK